VQASSGMICHLVTAADQVPPLMNGTGSPDAARGRTLGHCSRSGQNCCCSWHSGCML
jgi:hypothetical protein